MTAHRRAWELAKGQVPPDTVVQPCPDEPLCVRLDHLSLSKRASVTGGGRPSRRAGTSTRVQVQLNGRRVHQRVQGDRAEVEAARVALRAQLLQAGQTDREASSWKVDNLISHYLENAAEQGMEQRTRRRYQGIAANWISPVVGTKLARRLEAADVDRCFVQMRVAGQSTSSMNYAKALLSGTFRWARRTGKVLHDPMRDFTIPKSTYVPRERLPPEIGDIALILGACFEHTPDIAPLLVLASTTGARLGELVAVRRSDIDWSRQVLSVRAAADADGTLKETKRREHRRDVPLDAGTLGVLQSLIEQMDERAAVCEVSIGPDAFVFSLELDCSRPILPDRVTKRLQVLKGHLGLEDKRPGTVELEDEALRLRRFGVVDRTGRPGPPPLDGAAMSYDDIATVLSRTQMWAKRACAAAERRERAAGELQLDFNLSFNGLRKFTSSELLDAGFNINVVAQRQGQGAEVLIKHYGKARGSARRRAAEHLGGVVHGAVDRASSLRVAERDQQLGEPVAERGRAAVSLSSDSGAAAPA